MKLIEKYKKYFLDQYDLKNLEDDMEYPFVKPIDIWDNTIYPAKTLNLPLSEKKQIFLELIEYYMRKGLLRFKGKGYTSREALMDELPKDYRENTKDYVKFDEKTKTEDVIAYFDKSFPKEGDEKYCGTKQKVSFDTHLDFYFYGLPPSAYWYYDGEEDEEDMEDMSKKEIEEYKKSCKALKGDWYNCDTGDGLKDPSKNIYKG